MFRAARKVHGGGTDPAVVASRFDVSWVWLEGSPGPILCWPGQRHPSPPKVSPLGREEARKEARGRRFLRAFHEDSLPGAPGGWEGWAWAEELGANRMGE